MTKIVLGPKGTRRRRWTLVAPFFTVALVALIFAAGAQAVHDNQFQLDGDVDHTTTTTVGGTTQNLDWDSFFNTLGQPISGSLTGGFTGSTFIRDFGVDPGCSLTAQSGTFCTADPTTYATGSKDTLDITPGWQCNFDHNVNSKIDIMNAYALSYTRADNHHILYFGMEKNAFTGTNDVGFWFIQGDANCDASSGTGSWTGNHQDGDVLVVSEFTSGGGVSSIFAYAWSDADGPGGTPGFLDPDPIGSGGDCKTAAGGDSICATTNSGPDPVTGTITTPWLTSNKNDGVGNSLRATEFFEGGIDITAAFAGSIAPTCFNTFLGDTRSSVSLTATLFDYARGQLGGCVSTLSTQENSGGPLSIGTGVVQSGTDTATLTVTGSPVWNGTLTWYLCGPGVTSCDTHGVQVTSTAVHSTDASHVYVSGQAFLTSAGTYCWHALFDPDAASEAAGVDPAEDDGTNECFTVNPVTPQLTTSATCSASPCVLGSTLSDTATLTGTASRPGTDGPGGDTGLYKSIYLSSPSGLTPADSSITWTLYGPAADGSAQCTTTKTLSPDSAVVSGVGTYGPVTYTTGAGDAVGKYTFAASYPADSVNTNGASQACADAGQNNANGEQITVIGTVGSASAQRWMPNDRITLTSTAGTTLNGTLTATLYSGTFTVTGGVCTPDAGATAIAGQQYTFTVSTATNTGSFNTTNTDPATAPNTTFYVGTNPDGTAGGAPGAYFWLIHYVDNSLTSPPDRCESSTVSITD
jgi:hypothetical protein